MNEITEQTGVDPTTQWRHASCRRTLLLLAATALALRIAAIPISSAYTLRDGEDAQHFYNLGFNLASGNGYSSDVAPPFKADSVREPLYPGLVALCFAMFGPTVLPVQILQAVLSALIILISGDMVFRIFRYNPRAARRVAVTAAAIFAFMPSAVRNSPLLLRETLVMLIVILSLWAVIRMHISIASALIFGAIVGIGSLCRANLQLLPFALLPVLAMQHKLWKTIRWGAVVLLVEAAAVAPWYVRNYKLFGFVGLSPTLGVNLYQRTWALATDGTSEPELRRLATIAMQMPDGRGPDDLYQLTVPYRIKRLLGNRYSYWELDRRFLHVALENAQAHPLRYLRDTALELIAWWYTSMNYSRLVHGYALGPAQDFRSRNWPALAVHVVHRTLCSLLLITGFAGLWRWRGQIGVWLVAATIAYFGLSTAAVQICYLDRYWVVIAPCAAILSAAGIWALPRRKGTKVSAC